MVKFKEKLGEEAFKELDAIIKREIDIRNIGDKDPRVKTEAINLLLEWLNKVYELDHGQVSQLDKSDYSLAGMFIETE